MGIGIGLVGMGIQWKYPEQGWLGKWVAILGAAIVAIAIIASIVRWVTIKEFEKPQQPAQPFRPMAHAEALHGGIHIPINVGTIQQNAEQRVESIQKHLAERSFGQPHIEFTNPFIGPRVIDLGVFTNSNHIS